jgi:hypothetical protein
VRVRRKLEIITYLARTVHDFHARAEQSAEAGEFLPLKYAGIDELAGSFLDCLAKMIACSDRLHGLAIDDDATPTERIGGLQDAWRVSVLVIVRYADEQFIPALKSSEKFIDQE